MKSLVHGSKKRQLLADMCKQWGGQLVRLNEASFDDTCKDTDAWSNTGWSQAPFTCERLAVLWGDKIIAYSGPISWPGIVHEMGHVFACRSHPHKCSSNQEMSFFVWEYALVAEHLQSRANIRAWALHNKHYGIDERGTSFGDLSEQQRQALILSLMQDAQKTGIVNGNCQPLAIR